MEPTPHQDPVPMHYLVQYKDAAGAPWDFDLSVGIDPSKPPGTAALRSLAIVAIRELYHDAAVEPVDVTVSPIANREEAVNE